MSITPLSAPIEIKLWEPQIPWIDNLLQAFKPVDQGGEGHTRVVGQAPTGFGKTTCFCRVIHGTLDLGTPTVVLAHRFKLIEQISARLTSFGIPHGIIAAGYPYQPWHNVQLAMVNTYVNKAKKGLVSKPEFFIYDEGHHSAAATFDYFFDWAPDAWFLAVTATSERPDGKPLSKRFTKIVLGPSPRYLMDTVNPATGRSYLVPVECYTIPDDIDVSHMGGGKDYNQKKLEEATRRSAINGDAVRLYRERCDGIPALVFCVSVEHSKEVAKRFTDAGIPSEALYGSLTQGEQDAIYKRFENGTTKVLMSCDMISEGVDLPEVGAIFLMRKTKSVILYLQAIGRGLRSAPGKERCLIFDMVGLIEIHGMPDAARTWSLEGNSGQVDENKWKQCQACYMWIPMLSRKCKSCGTECGAGVGGGQKRDTSTNANVELGLIDDVKLRERMLKKLLAERKTKEKNKKLHKAQTLQEFYEIAKEYGYQPGWAMVQWNIWQKRKRGGKR